jgi:glycosyltransferase involved in cell wall biosynthesis
VIPARNEATVIGRTLRALFDGLDPSVEVVVVCNGCTDGTVEVVRSLAFPLTVLDLPPLGKTGALREADRVVRSLPRLYVDADVVLTGAAANSVLRALADGAVAARPGVRFSTRDCSWPVRRYVAVKEQLPSVRSDLCGGGMYGLSAAARARFDEFPDLIGDDLFVARLVTRDEVRILDDIEPVQIEVPRTARALLKVLARVYRGTGELARVRPDIGEPTTRSTIAELRHLARRPANWVDVAVYVALVSGGRWGARRSADGWERDESARTPVGGP